MNKHSFRHVSSENGPRMSETPPFLSEWAMVLPRVNRTVVDADEIGRLRKQLEWDKRDCDWGEGHWTRIAEIVRFSSSPCLL